MVVRHRSALPDHLVLIHDAQGRVVMAVVGTDGAPRVARQTDGPGLSFEQWREL